jgi:hypothetical protein
MFPVVSAIGGAVGWEVARRAKKAAAKPAEEALKELRERERELRKELEVSQTNNQTVRPEEGTLPCARLVRSCRAVALAVRSRPPPTPP